MIKEKITIIVIEDNIIEREILKYWIYQCSKRYINLDIKIYSANNGVNAMGLILLLSPQIILVDSTLQDFSGIEIVDFIAKNSNKIPVLNSIKPILLTESENATISIPTPITVSKNSKDFLKKFLKFMDINYQFISKTSRYSVNFLKVDLGKTFTESKLSGLCFYLSNKSDLLSKEIKGLLFEKAFAYSRWVLHRLFADAVFILFIILINKQVPEDNKLQAKSDIIEYRTRFYPKIFFGIISILLIILLFISLILSLQVIFEFI
jgi:CheY-like chemotaxis protein